MVDPKEYLELGMMFHGHKCPANRTKWLWMYVLDFLGVSCETARWFRQKVAVISMGS